MKNTTHNLFVQEYVKDFSVKRAAKTLGLEPDQCYKFLEIPEVSRAVENAIVGRMDFDATITKRNRFIVHTLGDAGKPQHYQGVYTRPLTQKEIDDKQVTIKLDPYRICDVLNIGGGAREQIVKKGLRWTTKGDDERKVIKEIMQACERRLEMLEEDGL